MTRAWIANKSHTLPKFAPPWDDALAGKQDLLHKDCHGLIAGTCFVGVLIHGQILRVRRISSTMLSGSTFSGMSRNLTIVGICVN